MGILGGGGGGGGGYLNPKDPTFIRTHRMIRNSKKAGSLGVQVGLELRVCGVWVF